MTPTKTTPRARKAPTVKAAEQTAAAACAVQLTPLYREAGFLASVIAGLPGLAIAYVLSYLAIVEALQGSLDVEAAGIRIAAIAGLLTVNPITAYLIARQYPRGKSVESVAAIHAR